MDALAQKIKLIATDPVLRLRLAFVLGALVLFRALAAIPIPGINVERLKELFASNQFLGLLNIFSGGGLETLSIVMLGVGPYITASIIMQLMTVMSPKLKEMYQEEGEAGRAKFSQYSRFLTVPLAILQGSAFLLLLSKQGVLGALDPISFGAALAVVIAGSLLLMWIGELVTEFGIGNGVSLIIFAGIVASLPTTISQIYVNFDPSQIPLIVGFLAVGLVIIGGVVFVTEAERPVPITYAKRVRGMKVYGGLATYLPLRVNQAGVIPIIFALSLLLLPQMIFGFLGNLNSGIISTISSAVFTALNNQWIYGSLYFLLVFAFTYFYTAMTFDPDTISNNLQKNGAFIPGVRPGPATAQYLARILTRITLVGALFLGLVAILPVIMQGLTGLTALAIGGTALLIAVSVVLDLVRRIDAQISLREY